MTCGGGGRERRPAQHACDRRHAGARSPAAVGARTPSGTVPIRRTRPSTPSSTGSAWIRQARRGQSSSPDGIRAGGITDRRMGRMLLPRERRGRHGEISDTESPRRLDADSLAFSEPAVPIPRGCRRGPLANSLRVFRYYRPRPQQLHRQAQPLRTSSLVATIAGLANRRSSSKLRPARGGGAPTSLSAYDARRPAGTARDQPGAPSITSATSPPPVSRSKVPATTGSNERRDQLGWGYGRAAVRRSAKVMSKVMSKAFSAVFQRIVQRCRPSPVGSRLVRAVQRHFDAAPTEGKWAPSGPGGRGR